MADLIGRMLIFVIGFAVCIMAFAMSLRGGFGVLPILIFFGGFMSIFLSVPDYH
tara:strand:- start:72 stop:233 length:162 start_codon:yes stop_codon:yes gene_type:complete